MNGKCQSCPSSYGLRICLKCHIKLCSSCQPQHVSDNDSHIFQFPVYFSTSTGSRCTYHIRCYLSAYCIDCRNIICDKCQDDQHREHKAVSTVVAKDMAVNRINKEIRNVQEKDLFVSKIIKTFEHETMKFEANIRSIIYDINRVAGVTGLVYDTKNEALEELISLQEGKHEYIKHVFKEINHLRDLQYILKYLFDQLDTMHRRVTRSFGDEVLSLEQWCQFEKMWEESVIVPEVKKICFPDLQISYIKPTADEIKNIMFRVEIRGNTGLTNYGQVTAGTTTLDQLRNMESSSTQGKSKGDDIIITSETIYNSSRQIEIEKLRGENSDLKRSLETSQKNHDAACKELEKSRKEAEQLGKGKISEFINRLKTLEQEIKQKNAELNQQIQENEDLKSRLKTLEQEIKQKNAELNQQIQENEDLKSRLRTSQHETKMIKVAHEKTGNENEDIVNRLRISIQETKWAKAEIDKKRNENEDLKNRLSQVAGAKLMSGNSSIADLGDKFRPTRIAEIYSELYDNEWTEAVEDLSGPQRSEDLVVQYLFITLKACYKSCSHLAAEQMENLFKTLFYHMSPDQIESNLQCHTAEMKQLLDARKGVAANVGKEAVKEISKTDTFIREFRRYDGLDEDLVRQILHHAYFAKCSTICWLMVVQDPPMVFDDEIPQGTPLEKEIYRPYTKSGSKILFSVWPAMFLQQGGALLVKGVAQCTN